MLKAVKVFSNLKIMLEDEFAQVRDRSTIVFSTSPDKYEEIMRVINRVEVTTQKDINAVIHIMDTINLELVREQKQSHNPQDEADFELAQRQVRARGNRTGLSEPHSSHSMRLRSKRN